MTEKDGVRVKGRKSGGRGRGGGGRGRGGGGGGGGGVFFFQAEDGIRDIGVTGVQTCALPIYRIIWSCRNLSVFENDHKTEHQRNIYQYVLISVKKTDRLRKLAFGGIYM